MKSEPLKRCWMFLRRLKTIEKALKFKGTTYWESLSLYYGIKMRKTVSSLEQLLLDNQLNHQYEVIVKNRIIDAFIYKKKVNGTDQN